MANMRYADLIATDGKLQKRIVTVAINENGYYFHMVRRMEVDYEVSYHADGSIYNKINGKATLRGKLHPLSNFKDTYQVASLSFAPILSRISKIDYNHEKLDAITYIDVRNYEQSTHVTCSIELLEPNNFAKLHPPEKIPVNEIHIFAMFKPWIIIRIYQIGMRSK